jgi:precorrin-3B C17-methyltransferase
MTPTPVTGRVTVVGLGPGSPDSCSPEVRDLLEDASDWVGYGRYLDLAADIVEPTGQAMHRTNNRVEAERARHALDLAVEGGRVVVISSGDPGVFAMASAVMEQLDADRTLASAIEVTVHAGISAAQAAAARAGAPLGHDFCVLSLSDNLKPWALIERRLDAVGAADLVVALYNPRSRHRPDQFGLAVDVLRRHRGDTTPVVVGRSVGRPGESVRVVTLGQLAEADVQAEVDMATVVIVGSSQSTTIERAGREPWVYAPRSHPD